MVSPKLRPTKPFSSPLSPTQGTTKSGSAKKPNAQESNAQEAVNKLRNLAFDYANLTGYSERLDMVIYV